MSATQFSAAFLFNKSNLIAPKRKQRFSDSSA